MLKPPFAAAATAVLVMLAGGPFGIGEAHARAIYTGTFDPEGPQYIWSGTHEFSVDTACLGSDGWKAVNGQGFFNSYTESFDYACGTVELTGGTLKLKDKLATPPLDVEQTVNFTSAFTLPLTSGIWGIYVEGGELKGVDTDLIGQISFPTVPLAGFEWWLRWESGKAPTDAYSSRSGGFYGYAYAQNLIDPVYLSRCDDTSCILATPEPATPTFTRVPEPGSLALVAVALMAAGLGWRRRRGA